MSSGSTRDNKTRTLAAIALRADLDSVCSEREMSPPVSSVNPLMLFRAFKVARTEFEYTFKVDVSLQDAVIGNCYARLPRLK